jgi:hypothetical protein
MRSLQTRITRDLIQDVQLRIPTFNIREVTIHRELAGVIQMKESIYHRRHYEEDHQSEATGSFDACERVTWQPHT